MHWSASRKCVIRSNCLRIKLKDARASVVDTTRGTRPAHSADVSGRAYSEGARFHAEPQRPKIDAIMNVPAGGSKLQDASVAIVGVGLIGGSIAAGLKQRHFSGEILGVGRNIDRLQAARDAGLLDAVSSDLRDAAKRASLFVFCTPVDLISGGVRTVASEAEGGTLLTDAGSVKQSICGELTGSMPSGVVFIGSHPLAGSERAGFEHARGNLFEGRLVVITPQPETPAAEITRLRSFWEFLGAEVVELSPAQHDAFLAQTSHLPHVVAAALAAMIPEEARPFAATGFRDTTRIAAGDPDLWTGILLHNSDHLLSAIDRYAEAVSEFRAALSTRDAARLKTLLQDAKTKRDALPVNRE